MDTKWRNISHSNVTKFIVFILVIFCFTGAIKTVIHVGFSTEGHFDTIFTENYYHSHYFAQENGRLISDLSQLLSEYKSEEHILSGGSVSKEERISIEENLYYDFQETKDFNPALTEEENRKKFKEVFTDQIEEAKVRAMKDDLTVYHHLMQNIEKYDEILFYGSDGTNVFTNTTMTDETQFTKYPAYLLFGNYKREFFPIDWRENQFLSETIYHLDNLNPETHIIYIAFTKPFLDSKINEWEETKAAATAHFYQLIGYSAGLIVFFLYLIATTGRKSFKDREVHLHFIDKLYTDLNLILCFTLIFSWFELVEFIFEQINQLIILITVPIATAGLILVLSLVKHLKNRTFFTHSLLYRIVYGMFVFFKNVYNSGSVAVKTIFLVVGYPLLIAATFYIFPITIGIASWFAFKKVKSFQTIQEGVARIKDGNLNHRIEVEGNGEFHRLAANINQISDGLEAAVESELKSERLKTELITNVSHDIRTPLTSIITYVDLLKTETDQKKIANYVEILEQKSQRLKMLTDDLFDAAKASSGNMPVHLEEIDIVSLLSQGLGELDDKIANSDLIFKLRQPDHKLYITADGKLLWRSIENLLSNIFKYAMKGSRVYIDIEDIGNEVLISFKNISAYELNISEEELMERFTRGDESRSSQGSGLGLSIAKSLIELQKGTFKIQIDGDLFKAMIYLPK